MLKIFKSAFKTTNDCIILAAPLIVFLSILSWYYEYASDSINTAPKLILACVTMFVMICGFVAAWFYMAKKTIALSKKVFVFDKDRAKALGKLAMSLPNGIGRLFLPIIGVISTYILIYLLLFTGIGYIIHTYIGDVNLEFIDIQMLMLSTGELLNEIKNLSDNELLAVDCWYMLGSLAITLVSFIYLYMLIIVITILNTLLMFNPFLYFFVLMLYYYFLVYIIVLLFTYYEQTFIN